MSGTSTIATTPAITPSELRRNVYRLLDEVLETGIPLEVERNGRRVRISPVERRSRLDQIVPNPDYFVGDPDDILRIDWSKEWKPFL